MLKHFYILSDHCWFKLQKHLCKLQHITETIWRHEVNRSVTLWPSFRPSWQ